MQVKYMDWRSDRELEEERLALMYHANSNHYPQLEVLTRSRMKMLKALFSQMKVEVTPAKRYFASSSFGLQDREITDHPFIMKLLTRLVELQGQSKPFLDFDPLKEMGGFKLDGPEMYILSKNYTSGKFELFYCHPLELVVQRVKEVEPGVWDQLFNSDLVQKSGEGAVFVTANINRSIKLFGERGYRLSLLEGGRLTERLSQCTSRSGLDIQPVATFYDLAAHNLLEIDGNYEVVLSCLIINEEE